MSHNTNGRIVSIYKSRKTMLELLERQGYQCDEYELFSMNEIDAMFKNSQLDMLVTHTVTNKKVYVKYHCSLKQTVKQIRPQNLDDIIEDLYVMDNVLTKEDDLIIIIEDEPNDTIVNKMRYIFDHDGVFVVIHNIKRLQFNILNHSRVPEMTILSESETAQFKDKFNIKNNSQLPEISRFDPQALVLCMRPGQVCKIQRNSSVAMYAEYYRGCV
jgi:DNA-directed RNA polymerase subunit H (RpoH/RPB5)/nitrate reductase NapAB chaperone NapD